MKISKAILSLLPDARFSIEDNDYNKIVWLDDREKPSIDEVQAELIKLENDYNLTEYRRLRVNEYPSIGDQLDDLFHLGFFSEEMTAKIQAIKDKYPKN